MFGSVSSVATVEEKLDALSVLEKALGQNARSLGDIVSGIFSAVIGDPKAMIENDPTLVVAQIEQKIQGYSAALQRSSLGRQFLDYVSQNHLRLGDITLRLLLLSQLHQEKDTYNEETAHLRIMKRFDDLYAHMWQMKSWIKSMGENFGDQNLKDQFVTMPDQIHIDTTTENLSGFEMRIVEDLQHRSRTRYLFLGHGGWSDFSLHGTFHGNQTDRSITRLLIIPGRFSCPVMCVDTDLTAKADGYLFTTWLTEYPAGKIKSVGTLPVDFNLNILAGEMDIIEAKKHQMTIDYTRKGQNILQDRLALGRSLARILGAAMARTGPEGIVVSNVTNKLLDLEESTLLPHIDPGDPHLSEEITERMKDKKTIDATMREVCSEVLNEYSRHSVYRYKVETPLVVKMEHCYAIFDTSTWTYRAYGPAMNTRYKFVVKSPGYTPNRIPPMTFGERLHRASPLDAGKATFLGTGSEYERRLYYTIDMGIVDVKDSLLSDMLQAPLLADAVTGDLGGVYMTKSTDLSVFINGILYATRPAVGTAWTIRAHSCFVNNHPSQGDRVKKRTDSKRNKHKVHQRRDDHL